MCVWVSVCVCARPRVFVRACVFVLEYKRVCTRVRLPMGARGRACMQCACVRASVRLCMCARARACACEHPSVLVCVHVGARACVREGARACVRARVRVDSAHACMRAGVRADVCNVCNFDNKMRVECSHNDSGIRNHDS